MKLKSIAGITMAAMLLFAPAVNAMDLNLKLKVLLRNIRRVKGLRQTDRYLKGY